MKTRSMPGQRNSNQRAGNYDNLPGQRKRAQWSKALTTQFYKIYVELTEKGVILKTQGLLTESQKWIIFEMMRDSTGVRYTAKQIANRWGKTKKLYEPKEVATGSRGSTGSDEEEQCAVGSGREDEETRPVTADLGGQGFTFKPSSRIQG